MPVPWEADSLLAVQPPYQHQAQEDWQALRNLDPSKQLQPQPELHASAGSRCTDCAQCERARAQVDGYRHTAPASGKPRITRPALYPRRLSPIPSYATSIGPAQCEGVQWVLDRRG